MRLGTLPLLILRRMLSGVVDSDVHLFVADVIKSFDTVDRCILDKVLCSLGLLGWFRHAYFEYHSHVRLRFKLAVRSSACRSVYCWLCSDGWSGAGSSKVCAYEYVSGCPE